MPVMALGISFELPEPSERPARMQSVREAIYAAYGAALDAPDPALADEALHVARVLAELAEGDAESLGLVALVRLSCARDGARANDDGAFVPLPEQDVARWDREAILDGDRALLRAASLRTPGPLQLEAAIQSAHCSQLFSGRTPWTAIESEEVQSVTALEDGQRWLTEPRLRALQPTGQRPWTNLAPGVGGGARPG